MNTNDCIIRLEKKEEYRQVENLVRESFWNVYRPGCSEHYVIHVLRDALAFIPELDYVMEKDGKIVFLRKLAKGGSEHSFGIHVAALAGMPKAIVNRSEVILRQLEEEKKHEELGNGQAAGAKKTADRGDQLNFFRLDDPVLEDIRRQLADLDINSLTPIDALNKLNEIKKLL